jgi:nicotinate-nucleotide adenylyltransferase
MKTGIFGGSFDPFHKGHLAVIRSFLRLYSPRKVFLVPVWQQPLKNHPPEASWEDRVDMIRAGVDDSRVEISDYEFRSRGVSYTVRTLEHFSGKGTLYLIMGSDAALSLDRWKEHERILSLATIVVYPREGASKREVEAKWGALFQWMETEEIPVSSSEIRHRLKEGRDCSRHLPRGTWNLIRERGLYQWDQKAN